MAGINRAIARAALTMAAGRRNRHGLSECRQFLKDNPGIRQNIDTELRKTLGSIKPPSPPLKAASAGASPARRYSSNRAPRPAPAQAPRGRHPRRRLRRRSDACPRPLATASGSGASAFVGQILLARQESHEPPALLGAVVSERPAQHRITGLHPVEDRALRYLTVDPPPSPARASVRKCAGNRTRIMPASGPRPKARRNPAVIAFQLSPASFDA